jgi:hypothetical protein
MTDPANPTQPSAAAIAAIRVSSASLTVARHLTGPTAVARPTGAFARGAARTAVDRGGIVASVALDGHLVRLLA